MSAPESYDLTAAAQAVIEETRTPGQGTAEEGAVAVWAALTGLPFGDMFPNGEAVDYARVIAAGPQTTAYIPPC